MRKRIKKNASVFLSAVLIACIISCAAVPVGAVFNVDGSPPEIEITGVSNEARDYQEITYFTPETENYSPDIIYSCETCYFDREPDILVTPTAYNPEHVMTMTVRDSGTYRYSLEGTRTDVATHESDRFTVTSDPVTFYKTEINGNGGEAAYSKIITQAGQTCMFPTATREGYTLAGWSTDPSATEGVASYTPVSDETFYAVWQENEPPVPAKPYVYFLNDKAWPGVNVYFWSESNVGIMEWPGVPAEPFKNNIYRAEIPEGATKVIFNFDRDQTPDLDVRQGCIYSPTLGWKDFCPETGEIIRHFVYYKNETNWNPVYAYFWLETKVDYMVWPGVLTEYVEGDVYRSEIPDGATWVIFNNDRTQTPDLKIQTDKIYSSVTLDWRDYPETEDPTDPTDPTEPEVDQEYGGSFVYYKNGVWIDAYAQFLTAPDQPMSSWPGTRALHIEEGIYRALIPKGAKYVIFSNSDGYKTMALKLSGKNQVYDMGLWNDYVEPYPIGDLTFDNKVNVKDATTIMRQLCTEEAFTDEQIAVADTNCDGVVDINDVTLIQMYLAEFDVVLGPQPQA